MTPKEAQKFVCDLKETVGPKSDIYISLSETGPAFDGTIYPWGVTSSRENRRIYNCADTLEELCANMAKSWEESREKIQRDTIRNMALKIIAITAEHDRCTEAALRQIGHFSDKEIAQFGEAAIVEANVIAEKGPFTIERGRRSNHDGEQID